MQNTLIHPWKLQLSSEKMLVEEYIQMDGEDLLEEELNNAKLIDMALEVVEASPSNLDLNVDPIPNVDDQPHQLLSLLMCDIMHPCCLIFC
jgi:hypothetical protein